MIFHKLESFSTNLHFNFSNYIRIIFYKFIETSQTYSTKSYVVFQSKDFFFMDKNCQTKTRNIFSHQNKIQCTINWKMAT